MPRFFADSIDGDVLYIGGDDARHITKSLRMRVGDTLTVCDGHGTDCLCEITALGEPVCLAPIERSPSTGEPKCRVTLYQGYPKGDKLELITQKAVELGAAKIVPVITSRSVARPSADAAQRRQQRLCRHALEAAKQCGRGVVPEVSACIGFDQLVAESANHQLCLVCYEKGGEALSAVISGSELCDVAVIIGPEGGFEQSEIDALTAAGVRTATLGSRILRTETAAMAVVTAVMLLTGSMD